MQEMLQKNELRFWLPIIISVVSVTLSWGALTTRMALVEQKQNDILAGISEIREAQKQYITEMNATQQRTIANLNDVNKRLAQIEAVHSNIYKGGE